MTDTKDSIEAIKLCTRAESCGCVHRCKLQPGEDEYTDCISDLILLLTEEIEKSK